MGLFGDNTKTYYSSTSTVLFEDTPPVVKQTVVGAITQNRNIASDLITNLANGIFFNVNQLYGYGASGAYPYGLPDGFKVEVTQSVEANVKYVIEYEIGKPINLFFVLIDVDITNGHYIYKATYTELDGYDNPVGGVQTWEYDESTGVYDMLDLKPHDIVDSPYYPIIPIRINQVNQAEAGQPHAVEIRQACRYLHLDPDQLNEAMEEQPADDPSASNPVEDAYVIIGVEVTNDTQEGIEYLFRFFDHMHGISNINKVDFDYWQANGLYGSPPINTVRISDANYQMELGWLYSDKVVVDGVLANKFSSSMAHGGELPLGGGTTYTYSSDTFVVQRQINATQYEEIRVVGLVHSNWSVGHELRTTLNDAFNDPDVEHSFIIPIRKDIATPMGATKQHDLMYSSIRLVVNDRNEVKLKWYQTGFFRFVVLAVSICISIFYPPFGVAAFSAAAVGIAVTQVIVMKLLVPIAFKALENLLGEQLALVISVMAVLYGGYSAYGQYLPSATSVVTYGANQLVTSNVQAGYAALEAEAQALEEDIELLEQEELVRQNAIQVASSSVRSDPYAILEPSTHVRRFQLESKEPLLILNSTQNYTDIARFTDIPDSYIRLGHTGF